MLTAKDIMTVAPITLHPEDNIKKAVEILLEKKINGVPVVDEDNTLVGVITQNDLVVEQRTLALPSFFTILKSGPIPWNVEEFNKSMDRMKAEMHKIKATTVREAMTPNPRSVSPSSPMGEVVKCMVDEKLYTLPVVENGKLVGVIGKEDVLRTLL